MTDALHLIKESTMYWMPFTQSTSTSTKRKTTSQVKRGIWVIRTIIMINYVYGLLCQFCETNVTQAIFNRGAEELSKSGQDMFHLFIQMDSTGPKVIN